MCRGGELRAVQTKRSPVHDSTTNGYAERGAQSFEQLLQTHKVDIHFSILDCLQGTMETCAKIMFVRRRDSL